MFYATDLFNGTLDNHFYVQEEYNFSDLPDFAKLNASDYFEIWVRKPDWEIAVKVAAVLPVILLGLLGNGAIIYLVSKFKSIRTTTNLFILNMAVADFITTLFCPWIAVVDSVYQNYALGAFFCHFDDFIKGNAQLVRCPCQSLTGIEA